MSTRVLVLSCIALGTLLSGAGAPAAAARRGFQPVPVERAGGPPPAAGAVHAPGCHEGYSNTALPSGFYFPAGAGVEVLDELHLGPVAVAGLCAFDFGYYKSGPGLTDATVTFYANNPLDDPPGASLATFMLAGLPSGEHGFHVEVPASSLAQDVWMGVRFNTPDAGLQLAHPAWHGASDDWFFLNPPGEYYNFGGNPRANFMLGVYATGTLVGVPGGEERILVSGFRRDPWPNPSARGIEFGFAIRAEGRVLADVLDVSGRVVARVADRVFRTGVHTLAWDGRDSRGEPAAAGVYLVRLSMPGFAGSRKVALLR